MKYVASVYKVEGPYDCQYAVIEITKDLQDKIRQCAKICKVNRFDSVKLSDVYISWDGVNLDNWDSETLEVSPYWFQFSVTTINNEGDFNGMFETRAIPVSVILNPGLNEVEFETLEVKAAYEQR